MPSPGQNWLTKGASGVVVKRRQILSKERKFQPKEGATKELEENSEGRNRGAPIAPYGQSGPENKLHWLQYKKKQIGTQATQ